METIEDTDGGADVIRTLAGYDIVLGGHGGDQISVSLMNDLVDLTVESADTASTDSNIVLGDNGYIDYDDDLQLDAANATNADDIDEIVSTTTTAAWGVDAGLNAVIIDAGGADTIETGDGDDIVIGGRFDDLIRARNGDNLVIGDSGRILAATIDSLTGQAHYDNQPITLGRVETIEDTDGGADTIRTLTGYDIVLGGHGGDQISGSLIGDPGPASIDSNIILGDNGYIDYDDDQLRGAANATDADDIDEIVSTTTTAAPGVDANLNEIVIDAGGADTIDTGDGDDIVIGGRFGDIINGRHGDNVIFGDSGQILADAVNGPQQLAGQPMSMALITTIEPADGGDDIISTGDGEDIVLAGMADDTVTTSGGNDIVLGDNGFIDYTIDDGDTGDIDLIRTTQPTIGGVDLIMAGIGNDMILAGTAEDTVYAGADNDLVFGDHGEIRGDVDANLLPLSTLTPAFVYTSIDTQNSHDGGDDLIYGEAGKDILLGQQGSDTIYGGSGDDDLIGGHNVALGQDTGDRLDGGTDDDVIVGDNASVLRRGDTQSPRMRALQAQSIFDANGIAQVTGAPQNNPTGVESRQIVILDHAFGTDTTLFGSDYIAGGAHDDVIFGQLGDDTIQGDGAIGAVDEPTDFGITKLADGRAVVRPTFEADSDGDDYIEGNGGTDVIFGNLGQDDIVGGSSSLFGLDTREARPDVEDVIYGGTGLRIDRNDIGDMSTQGHARDADVILGDNGNILRLVGTNGQDSDAFLTYNYDNYDANLRLIPRAYELLDYTPGVSDIGAADVVYGGTGDDVIHGQGGNDVLFGDGRDDNIYGGTGHDRIYGGSGEDGIVADDGTIFTSRNGQAEPLNLLFGANAQVSIDVPGPNVGTVEFITGLLHKSVELTAWETGGNDIIYGGLGDDYIHAGQGDDAVSGAEALDAHYYNGPQTDLNPLLYDAATGKFAAYDADNPRLKVVGFLLNFDAFDLYGQVIEDGKDRIFGDLGNDWLVGGTGHDRLFGGLGDDLMNVDDNHDTNFGLNDVVDPLAWMDFAIGGEGRDVMLANSGLDRMVDWHGEFNTYIVPFSRFGLPTVVRAGNPHYRQFIEDLGFGSGIDTSLTEPNGELGMSQHGNTGGPRDPQAGNGRGPYDNDGAPEDDTEKILTPHGSTPGGSPPVGPGTGSLIAGTKFEDTDQDGVRDAYEVGLAGWTIYLDLDGSATLDAGEPFVATGQDGAYIFSGLDAGTYQVREAMQDGWAQTYPSDGSHVVQLAADQMSVGNDFGNYELPVLAVEIEKAINAADPYAPTAAEDADLPTGPELAIGTDVTWTYLVTNQGNVAVSLAQIRDDFGTDDTGDDFTPAFVGGDPNGNGTLDPGETWLYTSSGTVSYQTAAGQHISLASIAAVDAQGTIVTDQDANHHFGAVPVPGIRIEKAINAADPTAPTAAEDADVPTGPELAVGTDVTWTYLVSNDGSLALTVSEITDDFGTADDAGDDFTPAFVSGDTNQDGVLDPDETWLYTSAGVVDYQVVAGQHANVATVIGIPVNGSGTVTDADAAHWLGVSEATASIGNFVWNDLLEGVDGKSNNGVGNGVDPQPPGEPPINDGDGTSPGNPGNKDGTKVTGQDKKGESDSQYLPDGIQDAFEPGLAGVAMNLLDADGTVIASVNTDQSGYYEFVELAGGTYFVEVAGGNFQDGGVLDGWFATLQDEGSDDAIDSDGDTVTFRSGAVTVAAGESNGDVDFGFYEQAVLDAKANNGVGNGEDPQPPGEPPVNDGADTAPGDPGNQGGAGTAESDATTDDDKKDKKPRKKVVGATTFSSTVRQEEASLISATFPQIRLTTPGLASDGAEEERLTRLDGFLFGVESDGNDADGLIVGDLAARSAHLFQPYTTPGAEGFDDGLLETAAGSPAPATPEFLVAGLPGWSASPETAVDGTQAVLEPEAFARLQLAEADRKYRSWEDAF